jgi:hypothetical protein
MIPPIGPLGSSGNCPFLHYFGAIGEFRHGEGEKTAYFAQFFGAQTLLAFGL